MALPKDPTSANVGTSYEEKGKHGKLTSGSHLAFTPIQYVSNLWFPVSPIP